MEQVILVDTEDREIGTMEKMEAHRKGVLHRAFSILLFNSSGHMLLQKRALGKYHSAGLWSNACCSHPLPGESMENATRRKLIQEMGLDARSEFAFKFIYKTEFENDLIEHEYDHVLIGQFEGDPVINRNEVDAWRIISMTQLRNEIRQNPDAFTHWFKLIVNHLELSSLPH